MKKSADLISSEKLITLMQKFINELKKAPSPFPTASEKKLLAKLLDRHIQKLEKQRRFIEDNPQYQWNNKQISKMNMKHHKVLKAINIIKLDALIP